MANSVAVERVDALIETEALGHACCREAMRHEAALDLLAAGEDELGAQAEAV